MKRNQSTVLVRHFSSSLQLNLAFGLVGVFASIGSAASAPKDTYYVNDHLATTVATSDASGEIAQIEADAFGTQSGPVAKDSRFTGKPYDADMGAYVFPFRNYRSDEARWMSADPSGFPDGVNSQVYNASVINSIDPLGLYTFTFSSNMTSSQIGYFLGSIPQVEARVGTLYSQINDIITNGPNPGKTPKDPSDYNSQVSNISSVLTSLKSGFSGTSNIDVNFTNLGASESGTAGTMKTYGILADPTFKLNSGAKTHVMWDDSQASTNALFLHEFSHIYGTWDDNREGQLMNAHLIQQLNVSNIMGWTAYQFLLE